ncbi:MAG: sensor histidine kinase [Chitinophagaceae bacterium]|nr:sensor histidine kinase [Chitinophagaceae bacterium]
MRKLAILLLICAWYREAGAQAPMNKDSLLRLLPDTREDTSKVWLLINIGNQYEWDDPETAAKYYLDAGELSEKLEYKQGTIKFIANYSYLLNLRGQFDSSMLLNRQSVKLADELGDKSQIGRSNANLGNVFLNLSQYDSAVYYYQIAVKNFEAIGDEVLVARLADLLQVAYMELRQHDKALVYGERAIAVLRNANDPASLSAVLSNAANVYERLNRHDTALAYLKEALILARGINYKAHEKTILQNLSNIYQNMLQVDSIKPYAEKAAMLSRELGFPESEAIAYRGLANYYVFKNDLDAAYKYISLSLDITKKGGFRKEHASSLKTLGGVLLAMHRYEESYRVDSEAEALADSLMGEEVRNRTLFLEKQFETEKKEARIQLQQAQLKQKNILNYILIGGAAALGMILLLSYRNYKHRQRLQQARIDELETEKQLTATEAILKGEEQERTRLAKDLHDGLGGMLSGIKFSFQNMKDNLILTPDNAQAFERSLDMLDSSIREMRRVAHNMMPEMLVRYGLDVALKEFCSEVDRSGAVHTRYQSIGMEHANIEQTTAVTVYRIVQELVNNAIRHAAASQVLVQLQLSGKLLSVTVEDNGKGFDTGLLQKAQGIGWSNIRNRVDFLRGKIDVDSAPGKGTSVLIEIGL